MFKIAIVDDHILFRKGLISLIEILSKDYVILFEADNGLDLQRKIDVANLPDIVLMDVNMPEMDGFASIQWLKEKHPSVKILVLSMIEKEETIVRMLKMGVKGYLCKDVEPKELDEALTALANKGFYYTDFITSRLVHSLQNDMKEITRPINDHLINRQEKDFIQLACS